MFERASIPVSAPTSQALRSATAWAALLMFGCAASDTDDIASADTPAHADVFAQELPFDAGLPDDRRPALSLVEVKANGTGCPASSWRTAISTDGSKFVTTFSRYEVMVDKERSLSVKDCNLTVALRSDAPFAVAVAGIQYSGYAFLEPGVKGYQAVNTAISGIPTVPGMERRTDLVGPIDRQYRFEQTIAPKDHVWSHCGLQHNVNFATRLAAQRTQGSGTGYLSLSLAYFPGDDISWQLATRPCSAPWADAGTLVDAGAGPSQSIDASLQ